MFDIKVKGGTHQRLNRKRGVRTGKPPKGQSCNRKGRKPKGTQQAKPHTPQGPGEEREEGKKEATPF